MNGGHGHDPPALPTPTGYWRLEFENGFLTVWDEHGVVVECQSLQGWEAGARARRLNHWQRIVAGMNE